VYIKADDVRLSVASCFTQELSYVNDMFAPSACDVWHSNDVAGNWFLDSHMDIFGDATARGMGNVNLR
jgi:hypothetical protein